DQARLGFAVAHALNSIAPAVNDLPDELKSKVEIIAQALREAKKPLIISGSNSGSDALIQAAANIAWALKDKGSEVGLSYVAAYANSIGLAMMEAQPLDAALQRIAKGHSDTA
ncbi:NADH-quinone oxidoreductase subunit G, partial [Enterobacter hormaechei]|nr:NADH-quinone oxidoreductase subunit G [Enterobacter hormaechei]